jgi:hypothetical protein
MTLRFTIDEFRKIPNNDKILFGVLIAIILVNSMIPRVREGATLMGVSVPAITYVDRGSMGVKGGAVRSISGTFTLQTSLPASGTITFSFPSGYFVASSATPGNIQLVLTPATASATPLPSYPATTVNLAPVTPLTPGTLVFTRPATSTTDLAAGTYKYVISKAASDENLFTLKTSPVAITDDGWSVETSKDATPGTAQMPAILAFDAGSSAAGSDTNMDNRQQSIMANITNMQNIEKQLFDTLTQTSDPTARSQLVLQINQISKARGDLYANMNDFAGAMQSLTAEARRAVHQQFVAAQVIEGQMNTAKTTLDGLREDKSNKLRLVEINNYYGRKYEYQTDIMKIIVLMCVPILVISVLLKKGFLPEMISTGLIIIIITAGIIAVVRKLMDLNRRNNLNFDQYDHDFNPNAVSISKTEDTNLANSSRSSLLSSCIGASCCDGTDTVWNSNSAVCIKNPCTTGQIWDSNLVACKSSPT